MVKTAIAVKFLSRLVVSEGASGSFAAKNYQGADGDAEIVVRQANAQPGKMLWGRGRQERPDFCLRRRGRAPDFTPAPDGQSGGYLRLTGFEPFDGKAGRFEEFPPAGGRVAAHVRWVVQHFNLVVQVIEQRVFVAFQINDGHKSAGLRQPGHFLDGFCGV